MAEKILDILIRARDQASATFAKVGAAGKATSAELTAAGTAGGAGFSQGVVKQTATLGSKLKGQISAFGPLLGVALGGAFLKGSLDAFDQLEKATKRLEIGFEAIHQPEGTKELTAWASDFATKTGILQADVEDFSGKLLNMGAGFFQQAGPRGVQVLEDLTASLEGMSVATGKSATMLMRSLGPAILNVPEKALPLLAKYGALTKDQVANVQALVDAGDDQAASMAIVNDLMGKFGGAAEKAATPAQKLKEQFNKIETTVGGIVAQLLPPLVSLLKTLNPILKIAGDNAGLLLGAFLGYKALTFLPTLLQSIGLAAAGMGLDTVAAGATRASTGLASLGGAGGPIIVATLAVIGFKAGLKEMNKELGEGLEAALKKGGAAFDGFSRKVTTAVDVMSSLPAQIFAAVVPGLGNFREGLKKTQDKLDEINTRNAARAFTDLIHPLGNISGFLKDVGTKVRDTADDFTNKLGPAMDKWARNSPFTQEFISHAQEFFQTQIDGIAEAKQAWADWRASIAGQLNFVTASLSDWVTKQHFNFDKMSANLDMNLAKMQQFGEDLQTIARDGGKGAQELVRQIIAAGPAAATWAHEFAGSADNVRHSIEDKIGKSFGIAQDQATQLQKALIRGMRAVANRLHEVAGELRTIIQHFRDLKNMGPVDVDVNYHLHTVGSPPPGTPANVHNPQIAAASGYNGIVTKPTWFHVAEAGFPEEVHIGRVAPGGGGGSNGSSGRAAVLEIKPDRRRFVQADNYELRYGGA